MAQLIAYRYANALSDLALEQNNTEKYGDEVAAIYEAIKDDKEFIGVISHPQISGEEKLKIFENAFKGKISDDILGLISVAVKKNRETDIILMLSVFLDKVREYKGITTAYVYSASPMSKEQLDTVKEKLTKNLNKQVEIAAQVDESLIGGLKIKVEGHVIDGTIKKKMKDLKDQLMEIRLAK